MAPRCQCFAIARLASTGTSTDLLGCRRGTTLASIQEWEIILATVLRYARKPHSRRSRSTRLSEAFGGMLSHGYRLSWRRHWNRFVRFVLGVLCLASRVRLSGWLRSWSASPRTFTAMRTERSFQRDKAGFSTASGLSWPREPPWRRHRHRSSPSLVGGPLVASCSGGVVAAAGVAFLWRGVS